MRRNDQILGAKQEIILGSAINSRNYDFIRI
ncbi:hypothetical protein DFR28_102346 [Arenicella xantha]|uniref:Uncharacterized protein n=1 Tax=Arenicella xantha TaxID=644221 RepID=A0A395JK70_9GAMM|nr:hypothetical protein DFR28_102346 [Arenicella xantha]